MKSLLSVFVCKFPWGHGLDMVANRVYFIFGRVT